MHVYEIHEITLTAEKDYDNPYTDAECWVQLTGPGFDGRIHGFWDGGRTFKVRVVATAPGQWSWRSGAKPADDAGLNGQSGSFEATEWTEAEKRANPNRRGFVRPSSSGHALQYADGTPFFLLGDTWWAAGTWRYPLSGDAPDPDWTPGPEGLTLENLVHYRQKQGYNSVAIIAAYPNWAADEFPSSYVDADGVGIRQAWEKFGTPTAKDMHDEAGNRPFATKGAGPMADFDRIQPAYFQSLDRKMDYLAAVGFVPFLETVRRDHGPSWKAHFDWPGSFVRYVQYVAARYGAYNLIFSPIHLDWIPPVHSLSGEEFNEAVVAWFRRYGPLPYGQPVTTLINGATHVTYGSAEAVPWLTMHSVGNSPRNHGFYPWLEEQFRLEPPKPTANLEPYYPGWGDGTGRSVIDVAGQRAECGSQRDNDFARAQVWGSVLSGGLAGHMYGTGAYDGTTVGEAPGKRPYIWEALAYPAGRQVGYIRTFLESEGPTWQDLQLASDDLRPRRSPGSRPDGLEGWAFMMRTADRRLAMLYFEPRCEAPEIAGLTPDAAHRLDWFDPISGEWLADAPRLRASAEGTVCIEAFPDGQRVSARDWGLKIVRAGDVVS